jgi:hypothetical protein
VESVQGGGVCTSPVITEEQNYRQRKARRRSECSPRRPTAQSPVDCHGNISQTPPSAWHQTRRGASHVRRKGGHQLVAQPVAVAVEDLEGAQQAGVVPLRRA